MSSSIFGNQNAGIDDAIAKLKAGDSHGAFESLYASNQQFRELADSQRGKSAEQVMGSLLSILKS